MALDCLSVFSMGEKSELYVFFSCFLKSLLYCSPLIRQQTNITTGTGSGLQAKKVPGEARAISSREGSSENSKAVCIPTVSVCWVSCYGHRGQSPRRRARAHLGKKMLSTT